MTKILSIGIVMLMVALAGCVGDAEVVRGEHYTEMHSAYKCIFGNYWSGQTFTPGVAHRLVSVNLYLSKVGVPNVNLIVSIRETEEKYPGFFVPIGEDIARNVTLCSALPDVAPEWVNFTFEDTLLEAGQTYAIIIGAPDANATAHPRWERVQDIGNYSGGTAISSSDYGAYWGIIFDDDFLFEEWGII